MQRLLPAAVAALTLAALAACDTSHPAAPAAPAGADAAKAAAPNAPAVIVSGLHFPRGFAFDKDGEIYVAEAGTLDGNDRTTVAQCAQVPAPVGPWAGGFTGRISRVTMAGERTTVASGLPSARDQLGDVEGPADIAFSDSKMYVMIGAGCAHGHPDEPSSLSRLKENGKLKMEANLSEWLRAHPVAHPEADDFEPDGSWYSMAVRDHRFYLVEANQGNLVTVRADDGRITRIADVSATENGHVVPTALSLVQGSDDFLVGELRPFPAVPGSADVLRFNEHGTVENRVHGFTAVLGVVNDWRGNIYVLESFTCPTATPCFPSPGSGDIVKVAPNGTRSVVASGLSFPTAMRTGPDGALYVSNFGYGPPGMGQILKIQP